MEKRGVCCSCQTAHPVAPMSFASKGALMRDMGMDEDEYDDVHGSAGSYVMAPHTIFTDGTGPDCEGAGDIPQVLVNE